MSRSREVTASPRLTRSASAVCATSSIHCLIVAPDLSRRENLGFAAREGGWNVTLCDDPQEAVEQADRNLLQMAVVDLSGSTGESLGAPAQSSPWRFLVEHMAATSRMLLLICGNVDDPCEEVWARHLGVWMYLPGAIDGTELITVCAAARETVERLLTAERGRAGRSTDTQFRLS